MDDESSLLAGCGEFCGSCPYHTGEKQPLCPGCVSHGGHPFWGECGLHACMEDHGVDHCGACGEFPCDKFIDQFDPNSPEGQRSSIFRAGVLAYRARHGEGKTLELLGKLKPSKH